MKLVVIEPIGIAEEKVRTLAAQLEGTIDFVYYDTLTHDEAELMARGKDADLVVVSNLTLSERVVGAWTSLKMIAVAFTGVDHIPVAHCHARQITVCNASGYSNAAVADLVFGMVINLYRRMRECDIVVRQGGTKQGLIGYELEGKKFGIIGTGAIGLKVAAIAHAFGCEVYAYSRTIKEHPFINYVSLETLLSTVDIVSLHTPLTDETKHLINKERLALMQPHAILINTARGPVVDALALQEALQQGTIAGAGIDVFDVEPPLPTTHPLFTAPNCLVTPHIAFATHEALEKRAVIVFDNIKNYLSGTPTHVI